MNEETYNSKPALPNKLLNEDGSITDLVGNPVTNATDVYNSKRALPNKWLNPDGTYSTLAEILSGSIGADLFIVVEELPATGEPNKIYLLVDGDKLIEYHWTGTKWDPIGMVEFDISKYSTTEQMNAAIATALNSAKAYTDEQLTDYVKNTDYATGDKGGIIKVVSSNGFGISSVGNLYATTRTYTQYIGDGEAVNISKGTLENVITGKGLVSDTDYATADKGGVIKLGNSLTVNTKGMVACTNANYGAYQSLSAWNFISKGTLENVITGKQLVDKTYVDNIVGDIESILETLDVGGGVE